MTNINTTENLWAAGVRARVALGLLEKGKINRGRLREHLAYIDELSKGVPCPGGLELAQELAGATKDKP